jgi:4-amino-4-deoxy-L-arabinose transferase-like glycosyltransferase
LIILVALLLRAGAALYLGNDLTPEPGIFDQISYDALAQRVLAGHGFSFSEAWWPMTAAGAPTAHWSFPYTLYLAGVYAVTGHHPLAARLLQAVAAGILMPWLTYRLARRSFETTVGLAAAAVSAVYVYFFYYGAALMTETFYMIAILWTFDLAGSIIVQGEQAGRGRWLLLGLAGGGAVLLRQTFLPVAGLVGAWVWWAMPGRRVAALRGLAVSLAVIVLMVLPWTIRNARVFGQFVLLNTNAGYAFFWANHPVHGTNFMVLLPPEISYQSLIPEELHGLNEAALEKALMRRGLQYVLDDPGRFALLSLNRLKDQFKFWPSRGSGWLSNLSRTGSFGLFMPFMIAGIVLATVEFRRERPEARFADWLRTETALWLGFFLLYTAMHLASWAHIRYRLPTDAILVIFAGLALVRLAQALGLRGLRDAP